MKHVPIAWRPATRPLTYELTATYFTYDVSQGRVIRRDEVYGRFRRLPHESAKSADLFEWAEARLASADTRDAPLSGWRDLPYARGFRYVFDFEAAFETFPIDVSGLSRDPDSWFFYVHLLDAHNQFDILRTRRYGLAHSLRAPGDSVVRESSEHFELEDWAPFVRAQFDRASRHNLTTWVGTGRWAGQDANVVYYRCDDVPMQIEMLLAEMKMSGMTNYHGHLYTTPDGAELLGGDLFEYLPTTLSYQHREVHLRQVAE
ncbi:MAG: hypothetical protein IT317_01595 [Anaerolineales bacterium]|nr:hypothetical protein [Anaerolineales bacterium]